MTVDKERRQEILMNRTGDQYLVRSITGGGTRWFRWHALSLKKVVTAEPKSRLIAFPRENTWLPGRCKRS